MTTRTLTPKMRRLLLDAVYRSDSGYWQVTRATTAADGRVVRGLKDRQLVTWLGGRDGACWVLTERGEHERQMQRG